MALNIGIVGLPNVGKSTLFTALTSAKAEVANYPFCTIDPNVGIVSVNDERMEKIAELITPQRLVPTAIEFVDIAGLVKGASKGEGLGNQFLGHIKQVDALVHVVRCFHNDDIVHVSGDVSPIRDIEVINTELLLADLQGLEQRIEKVKKITKSGDVNAKEKLETLEKIKNALNDGTPIRKLSLNSEEKTHISDLFLITQKPVLYVANVDEDTVGKSNPLLDEVRAYAKNENALVVEICGQLETEISKLDKAERNDFLDALGLKESGLDRLVKAGYKLLDLVTYFTAGEQEVRAWTIRNGTLAPQAAGVIHSDFEKGFIKAEIYHYDDLIKYGSVAGVKEKGLYRLEGKEYLVKDGDIIFFKFNVTR